MHSQWSSLRRWPQSKYSSITTLPFFYYHSSVICYCHRSIHTYIDPIMFDSFLFRFFTWIEMITTEENPHLSILFRSFFLSDFLLFLLFLNSETIDDLIWLIYMFDDSALEEIPRRWQASSTFGF
jgi:hypothetical protein